jgi:hypothetical protein
MLTNVKNPVYSINFKDDKTKTKLDLELRLKQPYDCNFNLNINLDYELYIKECNKKISINSSILTNYNSINNTVDFLDIKINYFPDSITSDYNDTNVNNIINNDSNVNNIINNYTNINNIINNDENKLTNINNINENLDDNKVESEYFVEVEDDNDNSSNIEFFIESEENINNSNIDFYVDSESDDENKKNVSNASTFESICSSPKKKTGDIIDDIVKQDDDNIMKKNDDIVKKNDDNIVKDEKYYEDRIKAILNKQNKNKFYERNYLNYLVDEDKNSNHNISRDSLPISTNSDGKNNVIYKIINNEPNIDSHNHRPKIEDKLIEFLNEKPKVVIDPEESKSNTDIYNKLYCHLELLTCSSNKFSINANILYIIADLMKFIDNFSIEGSEKKKILIDTLNKFLIEKNFSESYINYIRKNICPGFIDILILVEKRKVVIKKKSNCFFPWIICS